MLINQLFFAQQSLKTYLYDERNFKTILDWSDHNVKVEFAEIKSVRIIILMMIKENWFGTFDMSRN